MNQPAPPPTTLDTSATLEEDNAAEASSAESAPRAVGFRVDTHVFRELGELLVGRDSTAINELIKNAYDADATEVIVHGEHLDDPKRGRFIISDNGHGMSQKTLEQGFLTIAGRLKDGDTRRSPGGRRMTGAKGVGRLAAQKLARMVQVETTPDTGVLGPDATGGTLVIDWAAIERLTLVDDVIHSRAVVLIPSPSTAASPGTRIELAQLRRRWTGEQRSTLKAELASFRPPKELIRVPDEIYPGRRLLGIIQMADSRPDDLGLTIRYEGELEVGESWYDQLLLDALWMIEIDASSPTVQYRISPTAAATSQLKEAARGWSGELSHPDPETGPFFVARIFVREGRASGRDGIAEWKNKQGGVRVYVEGFRVLPYGEPGDDWLELDRDYTRRSTGSLPYLDPYRDKLRSRSSLDKIDRESLSMLPGRNYWGAVFLTEGKLGGLRMVVNREGFVADEAWRLVQKLVRVGIDLSIRQRAAAAMARPTRQPLAQHRAQEGNGDSPPPRVPPDAGPTITQPPVPSPAGPVLSAEPAEVLTTLHSLRAAIAQNELSAALTLVQRLELSPSFAAPSDEGAIDPDAEYQHLSWTLESVGLQLHAFVHEINSALSMVNTTLSYLKHLRQEALAHTQKLTPGLNRLEESLTVLRQHLERQASTLISVTGPDARRRRAALSYRERFTIAMSLLQQVANRRAVLVENAIPETLRSPPMFGAELTMLFSNLLSNAIKNAGKPGRVVARGSSDGSGTTLVLENTGVRVELSEAERWFRPFESTTLRPDPVLGQGMGMGLPISRRIVDSYRGDLRFIEPSQGFATAVSLRLPLR